MNQLYKFCIPNKQIELKERMADAVQLLDGHSPRVKENIPLIQGIQNLKVLC